VDTDEANPDLMSPWVLRIVLDPRAFTVKKLNMADIATKITEFYRHGVHVIYTDDNSQTGLVLRVRILIAEEDKHGPEGEDIDSGSHDHELLRRMQKNLIENLHLRGVPGIKKVYLSKKKYLKWKDSAGRFVPVEEWILETDGTNLAAVLAVPSVNHTLTVSNDVVEMCQILGIEGARSSLFNELRTVLSFDGAYVNYRHIACLADCMTFGGYLMAVSRHGINAGESGPMLRASFEETVEIFMNAAMYSQYDILNGVTENVMLGQLGRLGTGMMDLLLDHTKLVNVIDNDTITDELRSGKMIKDYAGDATPLNGYFQASSPGGDLFGQTPLIAAFSEWGGQTPAQSPYVSGGYLSPAGGFSPSSQSPSYLSISKSPAYISKSPARSSASPFNPQRYIFL
jgi:DNA-directed RNA polymerase II subunit RPB1